MASAQTYHREFLIQQKYLNIPIESGQKRLKVIFDVAGSDSTSAKIKLADRQVDYWVFRDVESLKGKKLRLTFSEYTKGVELIDQSDHIKGEDSLYNEIKRPQVHFTTRRGWNNDPNGLVFHKGEYHMFYQHNPYEREWENMHWGHAISKDLLHWQELPLALFPDTLGTMFSGSAVIDEKNSGGWGKDAMVAFYTAAGKKMTQNIAYSLDGGRTFKKYEGNPVLGPDRDPKVFWYAPTQKWVMVLYNENYNIIYNSDDLRKWTMKSKVMGFYECPEFFELDVDGDPKNKKWVMYGASGTYMIGSFDGQKFTPESGKYHYTSGALYAAQTFNQVKDGRRIQIGWGRIEQPGMPFNQMMLFPNELTLRKTREGIRLYCNPVRELAQLHNKEYAWENTNVKTVNEALKNVQGDLFHGIIEFDLGKGLGMELQYRGKPIVFYDGNFNTFMRTPVIGSKPDQMKFKIEFIIDKTSVEAFFEDGKHFYSGPLEKATNEGLKLFGDLNVHSFRLYELKSIWH